MRLPDGLEFAIADPTSADVRILLAAHLEFARAVTPPGHVHALDEAGLATDDVTLFAIWEAHRLLGIGALRELDNRHGEIKSMHTAVDARGRGVGRRMLDELQAVARDRGYDRLSLETGTMDAFGPARRLYASAGFEVCRPFGDYQPVPNSVCMTLRLTDT